MPSLFLNSAFKRLYLIYITTFQRSVLPASSLIALMMEAVQTSETSVNSYQSTLRYNPEDSHLHYEKLFYILCKSVSLVVWKLDDVMTLELNNNKHSVLYSFHFIISRISI
jgi:hypothetical protein